MTATGELSASLSWSLLELGAMARGSLGGGNGVHLGGFFGFVDRLPSGVRFELAATAGVHRLTQLGAMRSGGSWSAVELVGPSSVTSGIDAQLPFVGLRLGAYKMVNPTSTSHLVLGAMAYADVDARDVRGTQVTQSSCGLFASSGCPTTRTSPVDATIGTVGLMMLVGWSRDLGP
jgi:hypothetical protein